MDEDILYEVAVLLESDSSDKAGTDTEQDSVYANSPLYDHHVESHLL